MKYLILSIFVFFINVPVNSHAVTTVQANAYLGWDWDSLQSSVPDSHLKKMIDHIKDIGYKGITFDYMVDVADDGTVSNSRPHNRMLEYIRYANSKGLLVDTKLHWVRLADNGNINQWNIAKNFNYEKFFIDAEVYLVNSSSVFQSLNVHGFYIGTENDQFYSSKYHDRWASIISKIRSNYKGKIYYDGLYFGLNAGNLMEPVGIWDLVDEIGLSFTPHLASGSVNDLNKLKSLYLFSDATLLNGNKFLTNKPCAWAQPVLSVVDDLKMLSAKYGKPIRFGESVVQPISNNNCGYTFHGDLVTNNVIVDRDAQIRGYRALIETINEQLDGIVVGMHVHGYEPWQDFRNNPSDSFSYWKNYDGMTGSVTEKVLEGYLRQWNPVESTIEPLPSSPNNEVIGGTTGTGSTPTYVDPIATTVNSDVTQGSTINNTTVEHMPIYPGPNTTVSVTLKGAQGSVGTSIDGIDCGTRCSYQFTKGTTIVLTATPAQGQKFKNWGGACGGNKPICRVRLNNFVKNVTATFK